MNIFDNFQNIFSSAGVKAKRTYDEKKIEIKINGYKKELKSLYTEIGKYFYNCSQKNLIPDEDKTLELYNNVTNINFRIVSLTKQLEESKTNSTTTNELNNEQYFSKELEHYVVPTLKVKSGDIKLKRHLNSVSLVRICPKCEHENDTSCEICIVCQQPLK